MNIFLKLNKMHFLHGNIPPKQYQFRCFLLIPYAKQIRSMIGTVKFRKRLGLFCFGTISDSLLFNSFSIGYDSPTFMISNLSFLGKGRSGTGTSRKEHIVSHSSLRSRMRNLSSGVEVFIFLSH